MKNNQVPYDSDRVNDYIDETNFNRAKIQRDKTASGSSKANTTREGKNIFLSHDIKGFFMIPVFKELISALHYIIFTIKMIAFLILATIYSMIGAIAVIMYMIFYEKIYVTLFSNGKNDSQNDQYLRGKTIILN
jgi:hypothetical protein